MNALEQIALAYASDSEDDLRPPKKFASRDEMRTRPWKERDTATPQEMTSGMSATQEVAAEIVRIAQTRVVQVEGVEFRCYQIGTYPHFFNVKKVRSTLGDGWCIDNLFFPTNSFFDFQHVARIFVAHLRAHDIENDVVPAEYYEIRFGIHTNTEPFPIIVWRMHCRCTKKEEEEMTNRLAQLLQKPPILVDTE